LVVLVYEPTKPSPIFWKLPGGRGEGDETPEETALLELEEETGLIDVDITKLRKEDKGGYDRYLFVAISNSDDPVLKEVGDEGEEIRTFEISEFDRMADFLPDHLRLLNQPDVRKGLQEAIQKFLKK
jgi:8-oxo-dGTP pyrophosphatase MutT (NUDIX family)